MAASSFHGLAVHPSTLMIQTTRSHSKSPHVNNQWRCSAPEAPTMHRRRLGLNLGLGLGLGLALLQRKASAEVSVGYRRHIDTLDGYAFSYPEGWIEVRGSGADIFFRDPIHLDENVSVEMSSPSSSRYKDVDDLGSPADAARKVLNQYLTEFMSTRIGVRRDSEILSSASRIANDGKLYYDIEVNVKSYANNRQLAVMPEDRVVQLEWDRRYLSVLGVENNRLYELRLQVPEYVFAKEENDLRQTMESFRVFKV